MIQNLIRKYNDRDSLYGDDLTNHLNMGLFALDQMGADAERIESFARQYISEKKLPVLKKAEICINDTNFYENLGRKGSYSSFIPYFKEKMEKNRTDDIVSEFVNILIKGEAGGAFHGLIRLAYAVELNDDDELAKALSYYAEAYREFPIPEEINSTITVSDPLEAIKNLSHNSHFKSFDFKRPLIIGRMTDIYEDKEFFEVLTEIPNDKCNSLSFSEVLLELYGRTGDFTMLHGFTSTHALYSLHRYFIDYKAVLKNHWYLLQLAYLSTGCVSINKPLPRKSTKAWEDVFRETCTSDNIHTVKMVYSLYKMSQSAQNKDLYRAVADNLNGR